MQGFGFFKSSGQDLAREKSFILWVHHPASAMETLMAASLVRVILMMVSPSLSIPIRFVGLT
jgi:hypothetical protein